jgi:hypothetical protein
MNPSGCLVSKFKRTRGSRPDLLPYAPELTIGRNQRAKNGKISTPNKRSTELRMVLFKLLNARQSVTPDRAPVILLVDLLLESALNEPSTVLPPHER